MKFLKALLLGIGVFILGFLISGLCAVIPTGGQDMYFYLFIAFAVLYLSSVVSVCTYLILTKIKKNDIPSEPEDNYFYNYKRKD